MSVTVQGAPNFPMNDTSASLETIPTYIPAVTEDVFDSDCWLQELTLTNNASVDVTVTITDKQVSPKPILSKVPIGPGEMYSVQFGARYMPGGMTWVCSVADALVGYARVRR